MPARFGGAWTEAKLLCLRKYLRAYVKVFRGNKDARYYHTVYVDAFAGCGARDIGDLPLFGSLEKDGWEPFRKGSATYALELDPPFDEYLFVEQDPRWCAELQKLRSTYEPTGRLVDIRRGDANQVLPGWLTCRDWERDRAVVFLDPYGMNVKWSLIEAIARTEAIDMWWLFPLSVGVNRLLTRDRAPEVWASAKLDQLFGNHDWFDAFYDLDAQDTLFGTERHLTKMASNASIAEYIVERLATIFPFVAKRPLPLFNSRNSPLFLFCFAAANPDRGGTGLRIAQDVIDKLAETRPTTGRLFEMEAGYQVECDD